MQIRHSLLSDESYFINFWNAALSYQKLKQLPLWPAYPEEKIKLEIQTDCHFSIFLPNNVLAGYFSLTYSDDVIWGEKECGDAIYIHRMCVNPDQKGNNLSASVLSWACLYASNAKRKYVRMDTWADNQRLVNYYISCGFRHVGNRRLGVVPDLPAHYNNAHLALFENLVDQLIETDEEKILTGFKSKNDCFD